MRPGSEGDEGEGSCSDFSSGDELLQQALPVDECGGADPPDASKILLCPNEYLRHVRLEASKLPQTLVSPLHTLNKDEVEVTEVVGVRASFQDFSEAWKHAQAHKFQKSQKEFSYLVKQLLPSKAFPSDAGSLVASLASDNCINWLANHQPKLSYFVGLSQKSEHRKGDDSRDRLFCFVIVSVVAFAFGQRDLLEDT
ncbi:unnamed protein product [Taenia asiatica]|uniref:Gem-associated protein 2 n=1 Tax=Taenia asiatica TaxID=60517 RepID=A0A158R8D8_TAEAS|nr:unnamed protein product [Taenia asiatica]